MKQERSAARPRLKGLVAVLLMVGCATSGPGGAGPNTVTGLITPEHFRFQTVRRAQGSAPGGWRAVCIHATVRNGSTGDITVCKFEVGMPARSAADDELPLRAVQQTSAYWANRAAHAVLSRAAPGEMTAVLCNQFKAAYRILLADAIAGATVSECRTRELTPVIFDIPTSPLPSPL